MAKDEVKVKTVDILDGLGPDIFIERRKNLVSDVLGMEVENERPLLHREDDESDAKKTCNETFIWTMGGHDVTSSKGKVVISLSQKLPCHRTRRRFIGGAPYFVATPISRDPVVLTTTIETKVIPELNEFGYWVPLGAPGLEVHVTVTSWGLDGARTGRVEFNWVCAARHSEYVFGNVDVPGDTA